MTVRPRRSALYLPADRPRVLEKARELACDVVIVDLEDAVAPDAKAGARQHAIDAVASGTFGRREVVIRVNGADTQWGEDDLRALRGIQPDAILLPKISSAAELTTYAPKIREGVAIWSMIETCSAILNLREIAALARSTALSGLVMGTNDLAKELHCRLDAQRAALAVALNMAVVAARANGLAVLDGVYNALDDDEGLDAQCQQGVHFGFDGKTLIHPRQIEVANRNFAPSSAEIEHSKAVVAAFADEANAGKGVLKVNGRMIERLHLDIARQVLVIARQIESA